MDRDEGFEGIEGMRNLVNEECFPGTRRTRNEDGGRRTKVEGKGVNV